ncbi:response regulator [bacterium]|nr:response regulator [bacterium]
MIEDLLGNEVFKILVVDDNQMVRQLLSRRLEKKGFEVTALEDGNEAIDLIKNGEEFDTLLLDIQMPKISGIEVLEQIRTFKTLNELPIIMVSALEDNEAVLKALEKGANDYITKPVDFPIAIARLKTVLAVKFTDSILKQQRSRSAAQAKMTSLGEMASGMAHEINNPLAVVLGTSQILVKMLPKIVEEKSVEKVEKMCNRISKNAQRVSTVIQYLREFSQPQSENEIDLLGVTNVAEILNQLQDISLVKARALGVELEFNTDVSNDANIKTNKPKMVQALFGVLENGIQAACESENKTVTFHSTEKDGNILFHIIDRGEGIPDEIKGKIYEPFFTTKEVGKGMGMGLSSAKGTFDRSDATIEHTRQDDKTVFTVSISNVSNKVF